MNYVSNLIRLAVITNVDHDGGIVSTRWLDQTALPGPDVPVPHPFAGKGGEGIFIAPKPGNIIALDVSAHERYIPVSILPLRAYYQDLNSISEIGFDEIEFPQLDNGEIVIQGSTGGQFRFDNDGEVSIKNAFSEGISFGGDDDSSHRCSIYIGTPVDYKVDQTGLSASGLVRRDVRIESSERDFVDFLTEISSEQSLEEIGWDPSKKVSFITRSSSAEVKGKAQNRKFRNPGLIEKRNIILEYGRDWDFGTYQEELDRLTTSQVTLNELDDRRERRSNSLSLSLAFPNELMEVISGTVVDIFGNPIDINRVAIEAPRGKDREFLNDILEKMRHTMAYHMEINARKGWDYRARNTFADRPDPPIFTVPDIFSSANNARDRSKFSLDIDKEGQLKINVPASSETGNISFLTRNENSSTIEVDDNGNPKKNVRDDFRGLHRNIKNQDIFLDQVGPGGIKVLGTSVKNRLSGNKSSWIDPDPTDSSSSTGERKELPEFIEAGTAFHNITQTAALLLRSNLNQTATGELNEDDAAPSEGAVLKEINSRTPSNENPSPNAGGRSLQLNLDGSIETSIGANTSDRISWMLDTAGALIARIGRDKSGRSAIIQTDGEIALEIGGFDYIGEDGTDEVDTRFVGRGKDRTISLPSDPNRFKSGKFVIRVRRSNGEQTGPDVDKEDHLIIIEQTGITIHSAGRMNFISEMDTVIKSGSRVVIDAPKVQIYEQNPRYFSRSGRRIS